MDPFFIVYIILLIISIVFWFFLNRASVRADRVVELLEAIDKKNRRQVELLTSLLESSTIFLNDEEKEQLITDYFHEARLAAENLILSDGKLNEDNVIKFAKLGNKYIEKEQEKGKDVNDSIVSFTMLKNQKFSVLSPKDRKDANELYKSNINFS
ncbi:YebO family protein [Proteus mirabilis]|uniref:YebO family protein n=1 Tax=Proteus mirabilis TaxID=584 RepID=UPI0023FA4A32|nr:YebO family protein [Proteus mirabilis]MDF7224605.1 YebO family protein [Proteus mirabilis]MDF7263748.1 YebO family protein [Proteus mirabilis]MDF7311354.1 YebO family protein [Proteus mirabilis]MDF7365009.1 YebO family protein [Proteus mirabilis]